MFANRTSQRPPNRRRKRIRTASLAIALVVGATACNAAADTDAADATTATNIAAESVAFTDGDTSSADDADSASGNVALWNSGVIHDIEIEFDQDAYDEMIVTYETTTEKDWISVTVTIDGVTYENAGLRLKGNSSLRTVSTETAQNPEDLHWLIRLDKYEDDQNHQGYNDIVIRSNSTETALNEAVAVELLAEAGLATQEAIATTLTFNGGETELRLAMQHPDQIWEDENFDSETSALYKAESTGDYSYRGDDPDSYIDVFDQEAGDDDLEPLIDFLDFINNTDDATFVSELADRLDVESFATYLAFQDLIDNFDDIDGPGNNSYLHYDYDTGIFTVVNWDLNLAFGTANAADGEGGPGVPGGAFPGGEPPAGGPAGGPGAAPGGAAGGPSFGNNVLVERFMANDEFSQLYDAAVVELTETLFADGTAQAIIDTWVDVLATQDIVDTATIESDANAVLQSIQST